MSLTKYKLSVVRERLRKDAEILEAVSKRLKDLCESIPAPGLEELHAIEAGDAPLSIEAALIGSLYEHHIIADESAVALRDAGGLTRQDLSDGWWTGRRPDANVIAHLRSGLRGRTLPKDFRPQPVDIDPYILLAGQKYLSRVGAGMVTDLLLKGYRWGG